MAQRGEFDDLAEQLAERFVRPARERKTQDFEWFRYQVRETPVFLSDVQIAAEALGRQCQNLNRIKVKFPCIVPSEGADQTPIPISLGFESGWELPVPVLIVSDLVGARMERYLEDRILTFQVWNQSGQIARVSIEEAIGFFQRRLGNFLSARLQGMQASAAPQPGVAFQVDTKSSGLRVYYAPIYWHNNQQVLDYPSTPVAGFIHPGRYHFGAGVPGQNPQFDFSASYKLPPDWKAYLAI